MTVYTGAVTTSGNSQAIRLEKSLFRAHPEFERNHNVQAVVIAPGRMLISLADESQTVAGDDPVLDAFLAFLGEDIAHHPERLQPLSPDLAARIEALVEGVDVGDDEVFPDDLSV